MTTQPPALAIFVGQTVAAVRGMTDEARAWLHRTAPPDALWYGGRLAVEPRYLEYVIAAAVDAGLSIGPGDGPPHE